MTGGLTATADKGNGPSHRDLADERILPRSASAPPVTNFASLPGGHR